MRFPFGLNFSSDYDPYLSAPIYVGGDGGEGGPPEYGREGWITHLLKGEDGGWVEPWPEDGGSGAEEEGEEVPLGLEFENDDAAWVMACTFIIFTMQTGLPFDK